ncbi:MAG: tRNA (adenosine(37)-N6)-threonylcarbamoyltransferase complex dimerization subunit type 1 TsaB [Nodosilinea sp.]
MIGLAIHTCSPELGLALCPLPWEPGFPGSQGSPIRQQTWDLGRDLAAHLHPMLMDFIKPYGWQDLAFLAVARGPGGFTGTRVGVVTARTLAQQLQIPLFGVSTLAAIAQAQVEQQAITGTLAVAMAAQREQVFTGLYQPTPGGLVTLQSEQILSPPAWAHTLAQYPEPPVVITAAANLGATAAQVLTLAYSGWQRGQRPPWSEVLPYYGQHPVATATPPV